MSKTNPGVSQLREALEACGGVATLAELEEKFKKIHLVDFDDAWRQEHFHRPDVQDLTKKKAFNKVMVLAKDPKAVFRFRLQGLPAEVSTPDANTVAKGRREILRVFDELDGKCTVDAFKKEYSRQFGVPFRKAVNDYFKRIDQIGAFLGQEVLVTEEEPGIKTFTLVSKEYEGRRRLIEALKEAGSYCTFKELDESYKKLFGSSLSADLEEYFGTDRLEQAIPKFSKKVLPIRKTEEKGLTFVLKPNFAAVQKQFELYKANDATIKIFNDKDLFSHQCAFLVQNVNAAIRRCEQTPTFESVCEYFTSGTGCRGFAEILKSTHPKLLKFMVPEKAWLFPSKMRPVSPTSTVAPGGVGGNFKKPPLNRMDNKASTSGATSGLSRKEFYSRVISIVCGCDNDVLLNHFSVCYKNKYGSDFVKDWPKFYPSCKSMLELSEWLSSQKLSVTKYKSTWRFLYSEDKPVPSKADLRKNQRDEEMAKKQERERKLSAYYDLESEMHFSLDGKRSHRSNFSHLI